MSDNETRRAQRASAGLTKAIRQDFVRPDTQIVGPDGKVTILGRRGEPDHVPTFQKSNPGRRGPGGSSSSRSSSSSSKQHRVMTAAAIAAQARRGGGLGDRLLNGPMAALGRLPLMNLVVTAALVHRLWCFVTRRFFGEGAGGSDGRAGDGRQLVKRGEHEDEYDEEDEYDMDERAEGLLSQMQQSSMLPAMLRASLPRPQRNNLAKRAAQLHHSRPREYRTAHQMMHGGPNEAGGQASAGRRGATTAAGRRKAQRRPLGKLEKMDLIVRQQVRGSMLAQRRQQQEELQQQLMYSALETGPNGPRLALPGPAPGPGPASCPSAGAAASALVPRDYQQTQLHLQQAMQLALAVRPALSGTMPYTCLPSAQATLAVPLPPFRPLPPDLRARMQGAPKPSAVVNAPPARAAAAGPPLLFPPSSAGPAALASPGSAANSVSTAAAGGNVAAAGASSSGQGAAAEVGSSGSSRDGAQGAGGSSSASANTGDCRVNGSDEIPVFVPRVARLAKSARKACKAVDGGG